MHSDAMNFWEVCSGKRDWSLVSKIRYTIKIIDNRSRRAKHIPGTGMKTNDTDEQSNEAAGGRMSIGERKLRRGRGCKQVASMNVL